MAIKNIVFDVGGVLVDFCFREYMYELGFDKDTVELFTEHMIFSKHWDELDRGVLTHKEAEEIFKKEIPGHDKEMDLFWKNLMGIVKEYDYSENLLVKLKQKGFGIYILSNYPKELSDLHWPTFNFLKNADGKIISGYERIAKPDIEIYKLLESRYGLDLKESLFVDDRQINIDGAKMAGMQGLLFNDYDGFIKELREKHIEIE